MLFNFLLRQLAEITPWGEPGKENLHWFGLTDGEYWLEAGEHRLLEYSEAVRSVHGIPRHCEYQIVRLHEDLGEMLPYILEPVPAVLLPYLIGETARAWLDNWQKWQARLESLENHHPDWDIAYDAITWIQQRSLDTLYLSPSARIRLWSDASHVFVGWDNRDKLYDGMAAWSADIGNIQLSRESFLADVQSFHQRLMSEMEERIEQVLAGALPSHIYVDREELMREHQRRLDFGNALARPRVATDWNRVRNAIAALDIKS
jgi:hypothetical protein